MLTKKQIAQAEAQAKINQEVLAEHQERLRGHPMNAHLKSAFAASDFERRQLAEAEEIETARAEGRY